MTKKPDDKKDEPVKITPVPDKLRDDPKGRQDHFNKQRGIGTGKKPEEKKPDPKLKDGPKKRLEDFQKRRGLDKNPPKP